MDTLETEMPNAARSKREPVSPHGLPLIGHFAMVADLLGAATRLRDLADVVKLRLPPLDVYVLHHPRDIEQVLVRDHELYRKDWTTRVLRHIIGQGLLVNEGASWRQQRRLIQPEFTPRRVDSYVDTKSLCTERALEALRAGRQINMHAEMMRLTLDIAGQTLFGTETSAIAEEIGAVIEQFVKHYMGIFGSGIRVPDWVPTRGNLRTKANLARLRVIVAELIAARRAQQGPGNDLLSRMIAARDEHGQAMSDDLLSDEAITMLLAGHETTALLLTFCIMLLAQHPEVERQVVEELKRNVAGPRPTAAELERLSFLDAVLRETLRLYPPAYSIGREALEDTQIGGYVIPRGAQIWLFQWSVQRDPRFYRQPDAFRPERWLGAETADLPRFAYFPFGGGPRICPGAHFALVEAKVILTMMLRQFSFQLAEGECVKLEPSITLRPKLGLSVRVHAR